MSSYYLIWQHIENLQLTENIKKKIVEWYIECYRNFIFFICPSSQEVSLFKIYNKFIKL